MSEKVQPDGATSMSRLEYLERVAAINGAQADTYRDLCDQLKDENATLRQQLADVTESMGRVEERCAALRELVRILYYCVLPWKDCDKCAMNGAEMHVEISDIEFCDGMYDRMRELGVEVD